MHKIFESNPDLKKAFITSDGTPFYQENDAKNHAKTLKDKTVEPVYNEKELQVVDAEDLTEAEKEMAAFEADEAAKEAKAELDKALAEFDPETTKYPEAVKLFKALGLESENAKQDTIYPLLVAAKASAQEGANTQV
ncbi:hypothetical protein QWY99_01245 [Flavobacterium branchiarum]|uniref:Uncharacterized protein n=1 Tax=Flavobacterium branchiarum TaxID=1114870 RepID=A0ABV5FQX8_9FLAO|nr:hypothetical protein [Flavobacterium branchiarum]MDN3671691.1 hypothetical protein [Flavobacterium branchiarum]